MQSTANLALPLIAAAQAGKHVTHNEALSALDVLVQLACLDKDRTAPPATPAQGERYLVAAPNPSGAWAGLSGQIVLYQDGAWTGFVPRAGWLAYVVDEADLYLFDGTAWGSFRRSLTALQNLALLGIGTGADAETPFAAKLNKALWTARGTGEGGTGDLRYVLNKGATANVLSLLMQTGFSGRAEIGLIGEDSLSAKVSSNGAAWAHAWRVNSADGSVGFGTAAAPGGPTATAPVFVSGISANALVQLESYAATGAPVANVTGRIGRGSAGAPEAILAGDRFFGLFGRGFHSGGAFSGNALLIAGQAEQSFTAAAQGTGIDFQTTDLGSTTLRSVVKVRANGALELLPRAAVPTAGLSPGQIVFDGTAASFKGYSGTRWSRLSNLVRFSASLAADATIVAGAWTRAAFAVGDVNDQGGFVPATNRFVAPEAGTYAFGATLAFRKTGTAVPTALQARFHRNGAAAGKVRAGIANPVDGITTLSLTALLALGAGDTVEVHVLFSGGDGGLAAAETGFWGLAVA